MAFITFNGVEIPCPAGDLDFERQQAVDSARNALNQVVAQKINRRIEKINLKWGYLPAADWKKIQNMIDDFAGMVVYWDNSLGRKVSRYMYWGDERSTARASDPSSGAVTGYINCACSLIDMGYAENETPSTNNEVS